MKSFYDDRVIAIKRYLAGEDPAQIYTSLGYSQSWFFKWKLRYALYGVDGLDDFSTAPHHQARQTGDAIETTIVNIRTCREKRERDETKYALVEAAAIHKELQALGYTPPSIRTIHNILCGMDSSVLHLNHRPLERWLTDIIPPLRSPARDNYTSLI